MYAVVEGVTKFKEYIYGKKFKIITDHKALLWIQSKEDFGNLKINRWLEKIANLNFEIEYRKGKEMGLVDRLSREYEGEMENRDTEKEKKKEGIIVELI